MYLEYLKKNSGILIALSCLSLIVIGTFWFFDSMFGLLGWTALFIFLLLASIPQVWKEDMKIQDFLTVVIKLRFVVILSGAIISEYLESFFKPGWPDRIDIFCAFVAAFLAETTISCFEDFKSKKDGYKSKTFTAILLWIIYFLISLYLFGLRIPQQ